MNVRGSTIIRLQPCADVKAERAQRSPTGNITARAQAQVREEIPAQKKKSLSRDRKCRPLYRSGQAALAKSEKGEEPHK
jgi:hypothetical protein